MAAGALLALAGLLAACQPAVEAPGETLTPAQAAPPAEPALPPDDAALAAAVRARLALDEALEGREYTVEVSGRRVRLRGAAPSTALRARIGALARQVEGVAEVLNEISVQPLMR